LPNTDDTPAPRLTPRPRFQPSLLGEADPSNRSGPNSDLGQMRMLDELEAVVRPRVAVRASPVNGRLVGLLAAGVALAAAAWWWNHQGNVAHPPLPKTLAVGATSAKPSQGVVASPVLAAASAAQAAPSTQSAPADAGSAPARIETMVVAAADPAPTAEPAVRPVRVAAPAGRPGPRTPAVAAAKAEPQAAADRVTTVVTPSGKWTVTVADETQAVKTRGAAVAPKPTDKSLASPAASVARAEVAKNPKADDADVLLLSALLAHVSRTDANGSLPEQDQLTIAQLVKRCDARATEEARECRRRICEGYWGKAEACPAPVTSKKG
jgi:cytoskeletal protein RodZ